MPRRAEPVRSGGPIPLPPGLAVCIALLVLEAAGQAYRAAQPASLPAGYPLGVAAVALVLAAGLYAHRAWARLGGALGFGAMLALRVTSLPSTPGGLITTALLLFGAWYLLSGSTARLFETTSGSSVDATWLLAFGLLAVFAAGLMVLSAAGVPDWLLYALGAGAGGAYALLGRGLSLAGWLRLFRVSPAGLPAEHRPAFRAALLAYHRRRLDAAEAHLAGLPGAPAVAALAGLIRFDRDREGAGLERLVADAAWTPRGDEERAAVLDGRDRAEVMAVVERRTALIDALVSDSLAARPVFGSQLVRVVDACTAALFVTNAEQQVRDWWAAARPGLTGERALEWLTLRLWDAGCPHAAERVAGWRGEPGLSEAARLVALMADWPGDEQLERWLARHAEPLAVVPELAEGVGLLLVGSRFVAGAGPARIARRVRGRVALLEGVAELWARYSWETPIEAPGVVWLLAGRSPRTRRHARFLRWWRRERPRLARFDERIAAGLEWSALDEWAEAERTFAEAAEADPERSAPIYNRAFSLLRLERAREAETLLRTLTEREPREALWWLRLGDALRLQERHAEAIAAYAEAQQQVAEPDQFVSLRVAVCQLRLGRDDEAEQTVVAAFGPEAGEASRDQWETLLEAEDAAWLAARYTMAVPPDDLHGALAGLVADDDDEEPPTTVH